MHCTLDHLFLSMVPCDKLSWICQIFSAREALPIYRIKNVTRC